MIGESHRRIAREEFLVYGRLLGWPVAEPIEASEESWRVFTSMSTPPARAAVLGRVAPWICPELVATDAARERITRWAAAGGLGEADTPDARRAVIRRVAILGDDTLAALVHQALGRMPMVVLDHLRRHAIMLPIGRACGGVAVLLPAPDPDAVEVRRLLVVNYHQETGDGFLRRLARVFRGGDGGKQAKTEADFRGGVAHEAAHGWLELALPPSEARPAAEAAEARRFYVRLATEFGRLSRVIRSAEQGDQQAARLAGAWGFSGPGADGERCARNARRAVLAEAQDVAAASEEA